MVESAFKSAVEAVLELPEEDQDAAAERLEEFLRERQGVSLLTEVQQAEVRRRLADTNRRLIPHDEVVASVRRRLRK